MTAITPLPTVSHAPSASGQPTPPRDLTPLLHRIGLTPPASAQHALATEEDYAAIQVFVDVAAKFGLEPALDAVVTHGTDASAFVGAAHLIARGVLPITPFDPNALQGDTWVHHIACYGVEPLAEGGISLAERFGILRACGLRLIETALEADPHTLAAQYKNHDAFAALLAVHAPDDARHQFQLHALKLTSPAVAQALDMARCEPDIALFHAVLREAMVHGVDEGAFRVATLLIDADCLPPPPGHPNATWAQHVARWGVENADDSPATVSLYHRFDSLAGSNVPITAANLADDPHVIAHRSGNTAAVQALAQMNVMNDLNEGILSRTLRGDDAGDFSDVAQAYLESGAEVNMGYPHHITPLATAVLAGNEAMALQLIERGAHTDAICPVYHRSVLCLAAGMGLTELVRVLIARGEHLKPEPNRLHTPLTQAIEYGHDQIAIDLLDAGVPIDVPGNIPGVLPPFGLAIVYRRMALMSRLLIRLSQTSQPPQPS